MFKSSLIRIATSTIFIIFLCSCGTLEYKRATLGGDRLDGSFGYLDHEVSPGTWVLEVARGGGLNKLGLLVDHFDRRANELCQNGYIGDYDVIPSHTAYFKPLRCYRRFCYAAPVISGVIKCASGNEPDKSVVKSRALYLRNKTDEDFKYIEPSSKDIKGVSIIKGYGERDSLFVWSSYRVDLIDNKDVSYVFRSEEDTEIPIAPGSHELLIVAQFNNEKIERCPCIAYVRLNVLIQENMYYIVKGKIEGGNFIIWVEDGKSGERVSPKYKEKYY